MLPAGGRRGAGPPEAGEVPFREEIGAALLAWYGRHGRDLPWRRTRDPYAVWVSEIMLQQTRVDQAGPYFERFMKRFPSLSALARASLEEVLKAWEGMGYYARARNLHRAARLVVSEGEGRLPEEARELRALPGIGAYTAAAVASIAFGKDEAVVDGNVARVLSRLFAVPGDPKRGEAAGRIRGLAEALLPPGRAGTFNQALMDLGALVCTPAKPRCGACPVRARCAARARGETGRFPETPPRGAPPLRHAVAGILRRRGRVLLVRRPPEGLLGGLYGFPGGPVAEGEGAEAALHRRVKACTGLALRNVEPLGGVGHTYSHFRLVLHLFSAEVTEGERPPPPARRMEAKWIWPSALERYPLSGVDRKAAAFLVHGGGEVGS